MPVSITYAFTPAPVEVYVYVPESGSARWSIRSRPQVAPVCVTFARTVASRSTYATRESARRSASAVFGTTAE
jgi:hypothetical protein